MNTTRRTLLAAGGLAAIVPPAFGADTTLRFHQMLPPQATIPSKAIVPWAQKIALHAVGPSTNNVGLRNVLAWRPDDTVQELDRHRIPGAQRHDQRQAQPRDQCEQPRSPARHVSAAPPRRPRRAARAPAPVGTRLVRREIKHGAFLSRPTRPRPSSPRREP